MRGGSAGARTPPGAPGDGAAGGRGPRLPPGLRLLAVGLAAGMSACASAGPPQTFRFASNREPEEAFRCAAARLALERFELTRSSLEERTAVALRRVEGGADAGERWWRVELSVGRDDDGRTRVEATASGATRPEGPYGAPDGALQGVIGRVSAACTW